MVTGWSREYRRIKVSLWMKEGILHTGNRSGKLYLNGSINRAVRHNDEDLVRWAQESCLRLWTFNGQKYLTSPIFVSFGYWIISVSFPNVQLYNHLVRYILLK